MVFSSIPFLFFFFPIFLILYYIANKKYRNTILLIFSLVFYAWGEPIYILLMLFSSFVAYVGARKIEELDITLKKKALVITIIINIGLLGFFKYADFFISFINGLFNFSIPLLKLGLPIGISFFTFQIVSYVIDVYRKEVKASHNFPDFMTYVSMFPQLIAGPIVRYETIMEELNDRTLSFKKFSDGLIRFLRGIFKKVIIANNVGYLWSIVSTMPGNELSVLMAWLGIIAFTFQIYFDFSGYSDMAIGMGKMLGFNYLENFNYPYIAKSITEFWRRWHISLSTWFRDYIYIPLGGSRVSKIINIRNILIVWILTGFWHGAYWNFVLWGLYYGILLIFEKFIFNKYLEQLPKFLKHIYAMTFVIIGWVIFAFTDINVVFSYLKTMFGLNHLPLIDSNFLYYFKNYFIILLFAGLFSVPIYEYISNKLGSKYKPIIYIISMIIYIVLFIVSVSYLVSDTYNPFLYFRF